MICELYFNLKKENQEWGDRQSLFEGRSQAEKRRARGSTTSAMSAYSQPCWGTFLELFSNVTAIQLALSVYLIPSVYFLF